MLRSVAFRCGGRIASSTVTRRCQAFSQSSPPALLIRDGTVVNADREFKADVLIKNGKIEKVFESEAAPAAAETGARVLNAKGKYVIPGGIDPHVHLEMPFMGTTSVDGYMSGTRAALAGGTTCLVSSGISFWSCMMTVSCIHSFIPVCVCRLIS